MIFLVSMGKCRIVNMGSEGDVCWSDLFKVLIEVWNIYILCVRYDFLVLNNICVGIRVFV